MELSAEARPPVDSGPPRSVALDAMGEFRIEGLESGRYVLTLRVGDDIIVLPPIDVGERPH